MFEEALETSYILHLHSIAIHSIVINTLQLCTECIYSIVSECSHQGVT